MIVQKARVGCSLLLECFVVGTPNQKVDIGGNPGNLVVFESLDEFFAGLFSCFVVHNKLANHGIVIDANGLSRLDSGIDPNSIAGSKIQPECVARCRRIVVPNRPRGRQKFSRPGFFGIDACLKGVAATRNFVLFQGQFLTAGHSQLPLDQINSGDEFRNGMLHLQPCIHFTKIKVVTFQQKLDRSGIGVTYRLGCLASHGS
mmetsp:Transcript_2203/g.5212  ORF Transcript_2203/g.5212 Transcript_2203/m.5212 type:complete len:202 (+) Transcript_2203:1805-2410(+)